MKTPKSPWLTHTKIIPHSYYMWTIGQLRSQPRLHLCSVCSCIQGSRLKEQSFCGTCSFVGQRKSHGASKEFLSLLKSLSLTWGLTVTSTHRFKIKLDKRECSIKSLLTMMQSSTDSIRKKLQTNFTYKY